MTPSVEFFEPAPLHRPGELDARVEARYRRSETAGLRVLRLVAGFVGVLWPVMVLGAHFRWSPPGTPLDLSWRTPLLWVFLLFSTCSVFLLAAAVRNRWSWYKASFRLAGGAYLVLFAVHLITLGLTGNSPLTEVHLSDYPVAAVGLLVFVLPRRVGFPLGVGVLLIASLFSQGLPLTGSNVAESLWAGFLAVPFLILALAVLDSVREIDRAATAQRRQVIKAAGSRVLRETEIHFMGFLHDRVLQHLAGVRRGLLDPVVPGHDFARVDGDLSHQVSVPAKPLVKAVAELASGMRELDPGAAVTLPDRVPTRATVPALQLDVLGDAAMEVLGNSLKHAPEANRAIELTLDNAPGGECQAIELSITDDGPGFDLAAIGTDRAGLRVSVLGRMGATPGCDVVLDTAEGEGTCVRLTWRRCPKNQGDAFAVPDSWLAERLNGLGRVFSPGFGVFSVVTVVAMGQLQDHSGHPALFAAAVLMLLPVMWGLTRGRCNRLANGPTLVVAAGLVGFAVCAAAEQVPVTEAWPGLWFMEPFALMCAFLAVRDRTGVAWATFTVGTVPILLFGWAGPTPEHGEIKLLSMIVIMLIGTVLPALFRRALRSLSGGLRTDGTAATDLALAASQRSYLKDSGAWLHRQLATVLSPTRPPENRRADARLLELRLRDAIRSPGFDVPETSRAVWAARETGATVALRDDRRNDRGEDVAPDPVAHARFHLKLQEALVKATRQDEPITVNARILPPGRRNYGTIVVGAGEHSQQVLMA